MGNSFFQCCNAECTTKLTELTLTPSKHIYTKTTLLEAKLCNSDILPHIRKRAAQLSELPPTELAHRIHILQSILPTAKNLRLKVINTASLSKGTLLYITPSGLEGSLRFQKDGFTYIGCKKRFNDEIVNDFVIPLKEKQLAEQHRGRQFQISYNIDKDSYWIRDLATGFGVFVKLDYALLLKDNHLINVGDSFLAINILPPADGNPCRLRLKVFSGSSTGEVFYFSALDHVTRYIHAGRNNTCQIKLEDPLISKVQSTIFYNPITGWTLLDGDLQAQRVSTNGTWMYISEDFEIYNGMVFKANQVLLQVICM